MNKNETAARTVRLGATVRRDDQWDGKRFSVAHQAQLDLVPQGLTAYCGYGKTASEAVANLAANVTKVLTEFRKPTILSMGDRWGMVWCQPHDMSGLDWFYQPLGLSSGGRGSADSHDEGLVRLAYEMATDHATANRWDQAAVNDAVEQFERTLATVEIAIAETGDDIRRYAAWQRAAEVAKTKGESDSHRWASDHQDEFLDRWSWFLPAVANALPVTAEGSS